MTPALLVRPWRAGDARLLKQASAGLSPASLWHRFGAGTSKLPQAYLRMLDGPAPGSAVRVALGPCGVVGWAEARPMTGGESEVAVVVLDNWQRRGIGTRLLRTLLDDGAVRDRRLHAYIRPGNTAALCLMRAVATPGLRSVPADEYVHYTLAP